MARQHKTPDEVSAARRKAAMSRHHPGVDFDAPPPEAESEPLPLRKLETIKDYDGALGTPLTWQDAKARESVVGELIANEERRDDVAIRRKKLFTAEQVETRDRAYDERIFQHLNGFAEFAASLVEPSEKEAARKKAREFITAARRAIAKEFLDHG